MPRSPLVLLLLALTACGTTVGSSADPGCRSGYGSVATAQTWPALRRGVVADDSWGEVASVRLRRHDGGAQDVRTERFADLLDRRGERVAQADVWRTRDGRWRLGVWGQCTD